MSHKRTEFELEQQIFLGGQISNKHEDFKTLGMLSSDIALPWLVLKHEREINACKTDEDLIVMLLELVGKARNMPNYTELTRLSMILGDTRQRYTMKGLKDELSRASQIPTQP